MPRSIFSSSTPCSASPKKPRRSWRRTPTSSLASLACAIWLSSAGLAAAFDLQGHRGARGLAPENTLAAFKLALDLGVTTLETDLAVTKDGLLVISHDSLLNPDLTRGPDGQAPGALIDGGDGYLYGTMTYGGAGGGGTIFKTSSDGSFATLHAFTPDEGATPAGNLTRGSGSHPVNERAAASASAETAVIGRVNSIGMGYSAQL